MTEYKNPPITVSSIITNDKQNVLIGKRGAENGKGKSELIGGFVEVGETLEEALRREIKEEIGIEIPKSEDLHYYGSRIGTYSDGRTILAVYFLCRISGPPIPTEEVPSTEWVDKTPSDMFADCDKQILDLFFYCKALTQKIIQGLRS